MLEIIRTNSENKDFISLVPILDEELAIRDGDEHDFYHQYNGIDSIKYVVLAYENGIPLGCGAIKQYNSETMEVKRMFTKIESRGKGVASRILFELEKWTKELSFKKCILETGVKQLEAIALYGKQEYKLIPNYGQYAEAVNSRCFEKIIK